MSDANEKILRLFFLMLLIFGFSVYCQGKKNDHNSEKHILFTSRDEKRKLAEESYKKASSIVERKCREYSDLIYQYIEVSSLPGRSPTYIKEMDCDSSVTLIVGGNETAPKEFPHMALFGYHNRKNEIKWTCGGSLISERFVLSAAHCDSVEALRPDFVLLGELDYSTNTDVAKPTYYGIAERYMHPLYRPPVQAYDIILYKLNDTVTFNAFIRPTCLSTSPFSLTGRNATVTGWGFVDTAERSKGALLKVTVDILDNEICKTAFRGHIFYPNGVDKDATLCAGNEGRRKDICTGDSGGPLQIPKETCVWEQIGIVSTGPHLCADTDRNHLGVIYTKVAHYIEWIQRIVWPLSK